MSGLSTKDVKTGGDGGLPKTIQPGNSSAIMHSIRLDQPAFLADDKGYFIILDMETPKPADDFEGFLLDKDNPEGGRYDGQVGRVKASTWAYKDGKTKSGKEISRDNEMLKFLKNLCEAFEIMDWWNAADGEHDTIELFVEALNTDKPWADKTLNCCICSREYLNKDGYVNHDLFFPKFSKAGIPFEAMGVPVSRLLVFNESEHVTKAVAKEVESFEGDPELGAGDAKDSGSEAVPEFEL